MTSRGVVRFWNSEDGRGAIDCAQTPGGCWAHFSELDIAGFRKLDPGQEVDFEWQKPTGPVEGSDSGSVAWRTVPKVQATGHAPLRAAL